MTMATDDSSVTIPTTEGELWTGPEPTKAEPGVTRLPPPTKIDLPADANQAPDHLDPYFRKPDGTPVTGKTASAKSATKTAPKPSEPEPSEAADTDAETDDTEEPERIGDAWIEVRDRERAIAAEAARIEAEQQRIAEAEREAAAARERFEAEERELKTDLHGFLRKNNLSFFELVKADLERQDRETDPLYIAQREAEAAQREAAELQAEREAEREREQQEAATVALAEERSALRSILEEVQDDAPHIAAFGVDRVIEEVQARYYELAAAGEQPSVPRLFAEAEALLAERARRFASIDAEPEQVEDDEPEAPAPTRKRGPVTLTNRTAAARHSGPPKYADSGERARAIAHKFLRWRDDSGAIH